MKQYEYFLFIPKGEKGNDYHLKKFKRKEVLNDYLAKHRRFLEGVSIATKNEIFDENEFQSFSSFVKYYKDNNNLIINKPLYFVVEDQECRRIFHYTLPRKLKKKVEKGSVKSVRLSHHFPASYYFKRDILNEWGEKKPLF